MEMETKPALTTEDRFARAEKITWFGIVGNIALTAFKFLAGIIGRSQAMIADATESLSDLISTLAVLISFKISKKPKDADHPYGHGKAESIATAVVGIFIVLSGLYIIFKSGSSLIRGNIAKPGLIALIAALVTIVIKEVMYRYVSAVGRRLESAVIMASAWDHRKDSITSLVTLAGITGARAGFPVFDPLVAVIVSFFIFKIGYDVLSSGSKELMDTALDQPTTNRIVEIAAKCRGVEHVYVRARRIGQFISVDLKIDIDPNCTIVEGHAIAKEVKTRIMNEIENVSDVMVHINPHYD